MSSGSARLSSSFHTAPMCQPDGLTWHELGYRPYCRNDNLQYRLWRSGQCLRQIRSVTQTQVRPPEPRFSKRFRQSSMLEYIESTGALVDFNFTSSKQFWFYNWDLKLKSKSEIDLNWDLDSNLYLEFILWTRLEIDSEPKSRLEIHFKFRIYLVIRNWFWLEIGIRNTF